MKVTPLTKEQLAVEHPDPEWRARLLRLDYYTSFLRHCILAPAYKIPDDLNTAISLTDFGSRVSQDLITKHDVHAKEARLMCLLELANVQLLVDIDGTDLDAVRTSLTEQIAGRRLLYPLRFGPALYQRAADLFDDERDTLTYDDTIRLLEDQPIGVFQLGEHALGPYGILESRQSRWIRPTRRLPLYHCHDRACRLIHHTTLWADENAPINEQRAKIGKILHSIEGAESSAWRAFIFDLSGIPTERYDDTSGMNLPYLLGDGLSDEELKRLVAELLNSTRGQLRAAVAPLGIEGAGQSAVISLDRASLLQLAMLCTNVEIVSALDRLVHARRIEVPEGEVRAPRLNQEARSGMFGLQAQLGRYGCRLRSWDVDVAPLRLKRLVNKLYGDQSREVSELTWQLREMSSEHPDDALDEFVRMHPPEVVLRRLVLARRVNVERAVSELGVENGPESTDDETVRTILWKLGFDEADDFDPSARFWKLHEEMTQLTQVAGVTAIVDQAAVTRAGSDYFRELERVLDDALFFTTWALTTDHISAAQSFSYSVDRDRKSAISKLNEMEAERDSGQEEIVFDNNNTLYSLCRGFSCLAAGLKRTIDQSDDSLRDPASLPEYVNYTDLKLFPFKHTSSFLDLLEDSRLELQRRLYAPAV